MNRHNDIEQSLARVESLAQQLLQASYDTRKLIEGGVSTPSETQPLSQAELAAIVSRRRKRMLKGK